MLQSQKFRDGVASAVTHLLLLTGAVVMIFPFVWMVLTSLKSPDEVLDSSCLVPRAKVFVEQTDPVFGTVREVPVILPTPDDGSDPVRVRVVGGGEVTVARNELIPRRFLWGNYVKAWNRIEPSFSIYFWNSFLIAGIGTCGVLISSLLAAYAFAFFSFPGKDFIFTVFLATMMVPAQVLLIPNFLSLKGLGWYDTYLGLTVPFLAGVFGIFLLRQFFLSIPRELYDAAVVDGCTKFQFLTRILLPLTGPPLVTLGIFAFLGSWNSLLWPLIVTESPDLRTIQVALNIFNQAEGTSWELMMAASTFCQLPLIIAYFLAQRTFIQGIARTGLKG